MWASDAFAEAHGRAEEALTELLEERGRCLREAASSVRNIVILALPFPAVLPIYRDCSEL